MAAASLGETKVKSIRGVPTHVIELPASSPQQGTPTTVLVIPGSPGAGQFYLPFAQRVQELFQHKVNVAVVSHAGHSPGCYREGGEFETPSSAVAEDGRRWFSLEDQVQHKMAYLEEAVSPSSELIIIGHSIGCYVATQMLKQIRADRVRKVLMLFPTIERIAESKNGQALRPIFSGLLKMLFVYIAGFISILPYTVQRTLLHMHLYTKGLSSYPHIVEGGWHLMSAGSWYNILSMAHQEMQVVKQLDASMLEKYSNRFVLYYGEKDPWVPDDAYAITKERFPQCEVVQDEGGCRHAFVENIADVSCVAKFVHSRIEV